MLYCLPWGICAAEHTHLHYLGVRARYIYIFNFFDSPLSSFRSFLLYISFFFVFVFSFALFLYFFGFLHSSLPSFRPLLLRIFSFLCFSSFRSSFYRFLNFFAFFFSFADVTFFFVSSLLCFLFVRSCYIFFHFFVSSLSSFRIQFYRKELLFLMYLRWECMRQWYFIFTILFHLFFYFTRMLSITTSPSSFPFNPPHPSLN